MPCLRGLFGHCIGTPDRVGILPHFVVSVREWILVGYEDSVNKH